MIGWIKLHRPIRDHWIWGDATKLKWWLDIVMEVNHAPAKVNIGYNLIECDRGQTVRSLQGWAERWNVSKDSARHFLRLLAKDKMIVLESLNITTRITVCNYDIYNEPTHESQTEAKRKPNGSQTEADPNKNNKEEIKNNKEKDFSQREEEFKILVFENDPLKYDQEMLEAFFNYWSEKNKAGKKMRFELEKVFEISKRLATWKTNQSKFKKHEISGANNNRGNKFPNNDWDQADKVHAVQNRGCP